MMHLIPFFQAAQDGNGVVHARLSHQHLLKAPFQRGVFLDVFPIFIQSGGAYAVQLAPGQGGFQHVAGVHGPFGPAGADHGVNLVDEQDDPSLLFA